MGGSALEMLQVFTPLTRLCRDACGYCTFAQPPVPGRRSYMTMDEVLRVASMGVQQGCAEILFTLGTPPCLVRRLTCLRIVLNGLFLIWQHAYECIPCSLRSNLIKDAEERSYTCIQGTACPISCSPPQRLVHRHV